MRGLTTKKALAAACSLVFVLGVAACGDDDDDGGGGGGGAQKLDLVIGDSIPLTGDLSDFGPPGQKGADLAVAQINDAIKTAGVDHTVNIVHEDNETNPQAAELVKLKFFAGLTLREAASALGLPARSADRLWAFARAWLIDALDPQ